jgi:hypothetical protein
MQWVILLGVLGAAPGEASAPAELPAIESEELLGFSGDGELVAVLVRVAEPRPDHTWDSYSLVRVTDVESGDLVASFRGSDINRFDDSGREVELPATLLTNMNPRYRRAQTEAAWERFAEGQDLAAQPLQLGSDAVRLRRDPDTSVTAENLGEAFVVKGRVESPEGYRVIVRTQDHVKHELTHFRHNAPEADALQAEVRAFTSTDGRSIAVVNVFAFRDGDRIRAVSKVAAARYRTRLATDGSPTLVSDARDVGSERFVSRLGGLGHQRSTRFAAPSTSSMERPLGRAEAEQLFIYYKYMLGGSLQF